MKMDPTKIGRGKPSTTYLATRRKGIRKARVPYFIVADESDPTPRLEWRYDDTVQVYTWYDGTNTVNCFDYSDFETALTATDVLYGSLSTAITITPTGPNAGVRIDFASITDRDSFKNSLDASSGGLIYDKSQFVPTLVFPGQNKIPRSIVGHSWKRCYLQKWKIGL
jgi:hypothetical protein